MSNGETDLAKKSRLSQIDAEARRRFGDGAEFAYKRSDRTYAILTLEQAVEICGEYIAGESDENLYITLERMFANANAMKEKRPDLVELARTIGKEAVTRYEQKDAR